MAEIDLTGHDWAGWCKEQVVIYDQSAYYGGYNPWECLDGSLVPDYGFLILASSGYWCIDFGPYNQVDLRTFKLQANTYPEPNRMPKDFTIQGSNDNSNWDTLKTVTGATGWGDEEIREYTLDSYGIYRYYKIDITDNNGDAWTQVTEIYLFGYQSDPDGLVESDVIGHSWSSDTNGDMTVSASASYGGRGPYKALNGSVIIEQNNWLSGGALPCWWKIDLGDGNGIEMASVGLQANTYPEPNAMPEDFTIQGSNNDSDWDTLGTFTGEIDWLKGQCRRFDLSSTGNYRYYKINITDNVLGSGYTQIAELYFYVSTGWTGKICGVTDPSKICGVAVADITKVCGV